MLNTSKPKSKCLAFKTLVATLLCAILPSVLIAAGTYRSFSTGPLDISPWNPRIALIIGNSAYRNKPLNNPVNDAEDMARMLERLGFHVITVFDGNRCEMRKSIRMFGEALKKEKGIGLFYYSGHGVQIGGTNYLIPVKADIEEADELESEAVKMDFVLQKMVVAKSRLNILLLDACRDNPFQWRSGASHVGLVEMNAPSGTVIGYSTAPGSVAADGNAGRNGVYTKYLLKYLEKPDLELLRALKLVTFEVTEETGGKQIPWKSDSLAMDFYMTRSAVFAETETLPWENTIPLPASSNSSTGYRSWPWWAWAVGGAILVGVMYQMKTEENSSEDECPADKCGGIEITW